MATLLVTCLAMAGWIRSQSRFEFITVSFGDVTYGITSMHSGLDFSRMTELAAANVVRFVDYKSVPLHVDHEDPFNGTPWAAEFKFEWRWDLAGFHIGEGRYASRRDQDCMIPYWFLVSPLTLLSTWLLLSKPRSKPAATQSTVDATPDQNTPDAI